jgi:DNA-binding NarL/FixJ family response regulator
VEGMMAKLSPRVRELVKLMVSGLAIKEAAAKMGIAHGTAKNYVMRGRKKLGYRTAWQMMYELGREK